MPIQIDAQPKGLAPDQVFVFEALARFVMDSRMADRTYLALAESRAGRFISVDLARRLSPAFATWDGRVRHTPSTGVPAGAYAHDLLFRTLRGERPHVKGRQLLISAGGAGSGKTVSLREYRNQVAVYFDNQLRRYTTGKAILDTALSAGWSVQVVYIHRPFEDVVRAVLERSQRTGRWNSMAELAASHLEAQATIVRLQTEFGGRLGFVAQFNASSWWFKHHAGKDTRQVGDRVFFADLAPKGEYHLGDVNTLRSKVNQGLRQALQDGIVCEQLGDLVDQA